MLQFPWQVVTILAIYRVVLFVILLSIYLAFYAMGKQYLYPWWFIGLTAFIYLLFSISVLYLTLTKRISAVSITTISVLVDILFLTFLISFNQSLLISYGILLNITIAAGSIIVVGRMSLLFAAWAAICVLSTELAFGWNINFTLEDFQKTGFLCSTFFVIAIISYSLSKRIRQSEYIAKVREQDVHALQQINALIVQHMGQGVLVIDESDRIISSNQSAWYLLGSIAKQGKPLLADVSQQLMEYLLSWRKNTNTGITESLINEFGVIPQFSVLTSEQGERIATLIILEDAVETSKKAQQIKLASLGRLTASIAHEIRNPLSAISQSAQMLDETLTVMDKETKLAKMIQNNCTRVNEIVESVLQLSRRKESTPKRIELNRWVHDFIENLKQQYTHPLQIDVVSQVKEVYVMFDSNQLHQIVQNIAENGLFYSAEKTGKFTLQLEVNVEPNINKVYLNIIDNGEGIEDEKLDYIFEPFFTSKTGGTGLGLYIARELCQANSARIHYLRTSDNKSCFRIVFNDSFMG